MRKGIEGERIRVDVPRQDGKDADHAFFECLINAIKERELTKQKLSNFKIALCRKHGRKEMPTDIEILLNAKAQDIQRIRPFLQTKPGRTGSGVAVVAIMTRPAPCPHGRCAMCPGGVGSVFGDVPQSYTGNEPAAMRGRRNQYDPYRQVMNRLEQYAVLGQDATKVELIIMGGTFPSLPQPYQESFVKDAITAFNDFSFLFYRKGAFDLISFKRFFRLPGRVGDAGRVASVKEGLENVRKGQRITLEEAQKKNEKAYVRLVGLTVETRPDWGRARQGNALLALGVTRIELGVQSVYDHALQRINRGHSLYDTVQSIKELKDLGFKLNFHIMPGIPGVPKDDDLAGMKILFADERFRPDMLKIYPLMVMPGTPLHEDWKEGRYQPLTTAEAAEMIADFKATVPPYCRIMRVQRDIPTKVAIAGVQQNNLRQVIAEMMKKRGIACQCIRCREVKDARIKNPRLMVREYAASGGHEYFISFEDGGKLVGFARLRLPCAHLRKEITQRSAILRELHVYGTAIDIGGPPEEHKSQHKGFGQRLLKEAEKIAVANGKDKMVVISGVGVREYYRKHGYRKEGPYMSKKLA